MRFSASGDLLVRILDEEDGVLGHKSDEQYNANEAEYLVVVVPEGDEAALVTPTPSATEVPPQNWEVWWALFFDKDAP